MSSSRPEQLLEEEAELMVFDQRSVASLLPAHYLRFPSFKGALVKHAAIDGRPVTRVIAC